MLEEGEKEGGKYGGKYYISIPKLPYGQAVSSKTNVRHEIWGRHIDAGAVWTSDHLQNLFTSRFYARCKFLKFW